MRLILCTIPAKHASDVAEALVRERLVACVNILPSVQSIYRWEGNVERAEESLMLMKTVAEKVSELTERIMALHPYEVPEIVAIDIHSGEGNPAYLSWVRENVLV